LPAAPALDRFTSAVGLGLLHRSHQPRSTMPGMALTSDAQVLSELMAAISLATDMGMAMPPETGLATCLVTMSLAGRVGAGLPVRQLPGA
jgi:hypothetical protein